MPNHTTFPNDTSVDFVDADGTSGTIDPTALSVGVINVGAAEGIVQGCIVPVGAALNLPFVGKTYPEITYDATGTRLLISIFK